MQLSLSLLTECPDIAPVREYPVLYGLEGHPLEGHLAPHRLVLLLVDVQQLGQPEVRYLDAAGGLDYKEKDITYTDMNLSNSIKDRIYLFTHATRFSEPNLGAPSDALPDTPSPTKNKEKSKMKHCGSIYLVRVYELIRDISGCRDLGNRFRNRRTPLLTSSHFQKSYQVLEIIPHIGIS